MSKGHLHTRYTAAGACGYIYGHNLSCLEKCSFRPGRFI